MKSDGSYQKGNWSNDHLRGIVFGRLKHKDSANADYTKCSIDLDDKRAKLRMHRKMNFPTNNGGTR